MMKILIIASSTSGTAPGKVFKSYINLIKEMGDVDLRIISNEEELSGKTEFFKLNKIHPRIKKLSISFFGFDIFDYSSAKKMINQIDCKDIDIVITMMSANHFFPLYAGHLIKAQCNHIKWINYSVDAIPAPEGWGLPKPYSDGLIRMIKKFMMSADKIYFSNEVMLSYQKKILGDGFKGESSVLYTLPSTGFINLPRNENKEEFNLLYTGGIYQARKVDQLLLALERLISEGLKITLTFVGTNPSSICLDRLSAQTISSIKIFGYTDDLLPFYEEADLLIDIDAAIKDDVFISSKFFNYLMINRPIFCITEKNSPVRAITAKYNIENIYFSTHDFYIIYFNILKIVNLENETKNRKTPLIFSKNIDDLLKVAALPITGQSEILGDENN